jgi:hypothetical protein
MDGCIELVCKPFAEDGIAWVVEIYYIEGHIFCSCIFLASEGIWQRYFPNASIFFPPKPINDESEGCNWLLLNFIWSKALIKIMSAKLLELMRTLLISQPAILALINMASACG